MSELDGGGRKQRNEKNKTIMFENNKNSKNSSVKDGFVIKP